MRIGVYGGTFNPIHVAHIHMAEEYADQLRLDKLLLMPAHVPPHKEAPDLASGADRLAMCRLAAANDPRIQVSDWELRQVGKSYTYRTLRELHAQYPDDERFLLMGADMFLTVQNWVEPAVIFGLATLCVGQRERGQAAELAAHKAVLEGHGARCILLDMAPTPLSSTAIRGDIAAGKTPQGLHPAVWAYIREHKLYHV